MFGCDAYSLIPKQNRPKLDMKSKKCIFLGYQSNMKAYQLWNPIGCKVLINKDVSFNKTSSLKKREKAQATYINKGKSPISNLVERKIDHMSLYDEEKEEEDALMIKLVLKP